MMYDDCSSLRVCATCHIRRRQHNPRLADDALSAAARPSLFLSPSLSPRCKLSFGKLLIKLPTALPTVCLPVRLRVANKIGFYSNFYELELQPHLKVLQLCVCDRLTSLCDPLS